MDIPVEGIRNQHDLSTWRYVETSATRDLRIDFMRGFVFVLLFTSHFSFFSWFSLVAWERLGVVSSAETFIILAGVVVGAVYGKTLKREGLAPCTIKLFRRAWTLYKIAAIVAGSIAVLRLVPGLDTTDLTAFIDPVTGTHYPLYPPPEQGLLTFYHVLFLMAGPHQFQVIGLYVALFILTPLIFWAIGRGHVKALIALSWSAYLINFFSPEAQPGTAAIRLTWAQFEYAFPLIAWQLIFVHGILAGYYRKELLRFFSGTRGQLLVAVCTVLSVLLIVFSLNHPLDKLPGWAVLSFIPQQSFEWWYGTFFLKYKLGPGRLLNNLVLLITVYALLTVAWKPIHRVLGGIFIPLGQESMYVFFVHIYLILLVSNTPLPYLDNVWVNTLLHAGALLLCVVMVRKRFLFRWIPH